MSATISISGWNFRNSFIAKTEEALSVADPSDLQWIFSESKKRRSIEHQQKCAYIAIKYTGSHSQGISYRSIWRWKYQYSLSIPK